MTALMGTTAAAITERAGAVTLRNNPMTLVGPELHVGDKAPDFDVVDSGMQPVNLAKIKSTKVEFDQYSNDYIVTLDLTWHSHNDTLSNSSPDYTYDPNLPASKMITKSIVGRLKYVPKARVIPTTGTPYSVFGLQLTFQFNCRDFQISSTSIADVIDIECNMNFNNK